MAQVPNNETFNMHHVTEAIYGDTAADRNLSECILDAIPWGFDETWKDHYFDEAGDRNNMLMFRNYDGDVDTIWNIGNGSFYDTDQSGETSEVKIVSSYSWSRVSYNWGGGTPGWFSFPANGAMSDEDGNPYDFTLNVNNPSLTWVGAGVTLKNNQTDETTFVPVGVLGDPG